MILKHEDKETDVAMGVKLMEVCYHNLAENIFIFSGDTDLSPAVTRGKALFPEKKILFAFPFDRKNKELHALSSNSFSISKKQYLRHLFTDPYTLSDGSQINKPPRW